MDQLHLLNIVESQGEIKGLLTSMNVQISQINTRIEGMEGRHVKLQETVDKNKDVIHKRVNTIEKKQYGIIAVASTIGGLVPIAWQKLVG